MMAAGRRAAFTLALVVAAAGALAPRLETPVGARASRAQHSTPATGTGSEWRAFEASLSATGRRETLAVEDGRTAVTVRLSGSLVVTRSDGLGKGFRADFLGFDDGGVGTGRAVWTDDAGDKIFSRMVGGNMQAGRQSSATITGGTGRYATLTGTYTFTWQYVMPDEHGVVHVRVVSMKGRYRAEPAK